MKIQASHFYFKTLLVITFVVSALLSKVFINWQIDMTPLSALHRVSAVLNLKRPFKWTESQLEASRDNEIRVHRLWAALILTLMDHTHSEVTVRSTTMHLTIQQLIHSTHENRQTYNLLLSNHLQISDKTGLVSQQISALHCTFSISKQELRKGKNTDINYYSLTEV